MSVATQSLCAKLSFNTTNQKFLKNMDFNGRGFKDPLAASCYDF